MPLGFSIKLLRNSHSDEDFLSTPRRETAKSLSAQTNTIDHNEGSHPHLGCLTIVFTDLLLSALYTYLTLGL